MDEPRQPDGEPPAPKQAGFFEMTPARRELLIAAGIALTMLALLAKRFIWAARDVPVEAGDR